MTHICVRCKAEYGDGSDTLLKGCSCGSRFFVFSKSKDSIKQIKDLNPKERKEFEKDVRVMLDKENDEDPVILDFESIKVIGEGKFEIDLLKLFKRNPVVYRIEEGKYYIDVASTFQMLKKR